MTSGLLERTAEVGWVVTDPYWGDVVSDLSSFHRVDDPEALPADRLWALVERLPAYDGVLAARLRKEDENGGHHTPRPADAPKREYDDAHLNPELAPYIEGL